VFSGYIRACILGCWTITWRWWGIWIAWRGTTILAGNTIVHRQHSKWYCPSLGP